MQDESSDNQEGEQARSGKEVGDEIANGDKNHPTQHRHQPGRPLRHAQQLDRLGHEPRMGECPRILPMARRLGAKIPLVELPGLNIAKRGFDNLKLVVRKIREGGLPMKVEKSAEIIIGHLARLKGDFLRFQADFEVLGKHINNIKNKYDDSTRRLENFGVKLSNVEEERMPELQK